METNAEKMKKNNIREGLPIAAILILSAFLNIWNIWSASFANKYYAAGVYSMGQNMHAFLFNSLDSVGFITIDKPPLGFWIQVLFTKVFGFSGAILILPQAIASIISVYLIYRIVKKRFSKGAGLAAALILAVTPIYVAVSRNNTIDGILILLLILASEQALQAAEKASIKNLIFAGIFIGLGFNVKMLQAYVIVPAIFLTYLIFAKQKFFKKILVCFASVVIMAVISLSWVLAVDMVPEESRPYIGSSDENSALDLALGYNGISRIINLRTLGEDKNNALPYPPNAGLDTTEQAKPPIDENNPQYKNSRPSGIYNQPISPMRSGGAMGESGDSGIFRLFNVQNAGQISWFMLSAFYAVILMMVLLFKGKLKSNPKSIAMVFFTLSFLPIFLYFSFSSGISHRYYFATIAPFMAGLVGILFYYLLKAKRHWIIAAFISVATLQLYIQSIYDWEFKWLAAAAAAVFAVALIIMIIAAIKKAGNRIFTVLLCTLLLLPAFWSFTPMMYNDNSQLPIAGPELLSQKDKFDDQADYTDLIEFLQKNRDGAEYLAMTESSMSMGAELILQSGEAVMALGGFNGGDTPLTLDEFIQMVEDGKVRFAVLGNDNNNANAEIYRWIRNNSIVVRPERYGDIKANLIVYRLGTIKR
ncbi:MAG: glycosyltransferase family 39 protein [Clostridia bacterium]|nr:glycosyltransferase family 39 protein [Clostridia bacterium]